MNRHRLDDEGRMMTRRSEGDGFARSGAYYETCLPVEAIQRAIDPIAGQSPKIPEGDNSWKQDCFDRLCDVIDKMKRNEVLPRARLNRCAAFALGCESERSWRNQILASISRTYAWTEAYAAAYADERERIAEIHRACEPIEKALLILSEGAGVWPPEPDSADFKWHEYGPIARAFRAYEGLRIPSLLEGNAAVLGLEGPIVKGLNAMRQLYAVSARRQSFAGERRDSRHIRAFFVRCLAEIFTALTGTLPYFDGYRRVKNPEWHDFRQSALELCGFEFRQGVDDLLRGLNDDEDGNKIADELSDILWAISLSAQPSLPNWRRFDSAEFQSGGLVSSVAALRRPENFNVAYPHLEIDDEDADV